MLLNQTSIPKVGQPSAKPTYHLSLPPALQAASPPAIFISSPHLTNGLTMFSRFFLRLTRNIALPACTDHGVPGLRSTFTPENAPSPHAPSRPVLTPSCCHNSPWFSAGSNPKIQQPDQWFQVCLNLHGEQGSLRISTSVWPGGSVSIP